MKKIRKIHKKLTAILLSVPMVVAPFMGVIPVSYAADTQIPELTAYSSGNGAKLEWSMDILDSDVLYATSFDTGEYIPSMSWGGNGLGGQSIVSEGALHGDKMYQVVDTYSNGNHYGFPNTSSTKSIMMWNRLNFENSTPLSITFYAKTSTKGSITPSGDGGWGTTISPISGVSVVEDAPKGSRQLKLSSLSGLALASYITTDTDPQSISGMFNITAIDKETKIITLNSSLPRAIAAGEQLNTRPWRGAFSFAGRSLVADDGWKRFSVNTTVNNYSDYNVAVRGGSFFVNTMTDGILNIDNIRFGYATEAALYRGDTLVYKGLLSDYQDNAAKDLAKPDSISGLVVSSFTDNRPQLTWGKSIDYGTSYTYTIKSFGRRGGESPMSDPKEVIVQTGIAGYSVVVDTNPSTVPDKTIETTTNSFILPNKVASNFYVHVAAVDAAGNVSEPVHYKYEDLIKPTLSLTSTIPDATRENVVLSVKAADQESGVLRIQLPNGEWVNGDTASYSVSENGAYTFAAEDRGGALEGKEGNKQTFNVTVTQIDKKVPTWTSVELNTSSPTNKDVVATAKASDLESGVTHVQVVDTTNHGLNATYYSHPPDANTFPPTMVSSKLFERVEPFVNLSLAVANPLLGIPEDFFTVYWNGLVYAPESGEYTFQTYCDDGSILEVNNQRIVDNWIQQGATPIDGKISLEGGKWYPITLKYYENTGGAVAQLHWKHGSMTDFEDITFENLLAIDDNWVAGDHLTYTASQNGNVVLAAKDAAGNVSVENLNIQNIDKVAPIAPTFSMNPSVETNSDVTVTISYPADAVTKQFKVDNGAWQTYTAPVVMMTNGTVYAQSIDVAGNTSSEAHLDVNGIDKVNPSVPSVVVLGDTVTITPGTDSGSGVKETLVKLNSEEWKAYISPFTLEDGAYTLQAKTVDKAGNESQATSQTVRITVQAEANATAAVKHAELVKTQDAVDAANIEIKALLDGSVKTGLQHRLDVVQQKIDANNALNAQIAAATASLDHANTVLTEADIKAAQALIALLPEGDAKTNLLAQYTVVDLNYQTKVLNQQATESEDIPTFAELQAIEQSINQLPASPQKEALLNQIATLKQVVEATKNIVAAEEQKSQASVDEAQVEINKLPSGQVKSSLQARLDAVQAALDAENARVQQIIEATAALSQAEGKMNADDIQKASALIEALPEGVEKTNLLAQFEVISLVFKTNALSDQIVNTGSLPSASELQSTEQNIRQLPDSPQKTEMLVKIEVVKQTVEATTATIAAEQGKTQAAVDKAASEINKLPAGAVKSSLLERLDAVQEALDAFQSKLKAATEAVLKAEGSKLQADVDAAQVKVELLNGAVGDLTARLAEVQVAIHAQTANGLLIEAEELPTPYKVNEVQLAINKLPDSPEKAALQTKLNAVTHSAEYLIPLVSDKTVRTTLNADLESIQKAEKYQSKTYIISALDKLSALATVIRTSPLYNGIVDDLQERADKCKADYNAMVAEQEFQTNLAKAQTAMTYYEKYKTATYQTKAQDAINLLPDTKAEKAQLQAQLNAMVADIAYQDLVAKAEAAVTNYEKYRTEAYKTKAADALTLLSSDTEAYAAKKAELQARFDTVIAK